MAKDLFGYSDYKNYLASRAGGPSTKKGIKTALARRMGCQPTYLSQVLRGRAHLSLEQAERANEFFQHSKDESTYFLLLVQKARAGTQTLAQFFQDQIDEVLSRRLNLTARLGSIQSLTREDQSIYYSSWIHAAIHIALTLPELRTRERLARHLGQPLQKIAESLDFLVSTGLAVEEGGQFRTGTSRIRLGNDSHNILKHHTNWRIKAIESLESERKTDLHYSGVISLSAEDVVRIKNQLLDAIQTIQDTIRPSKEEELCAVNFDFFSLKTPLKG